MAAEQTAAGLLHGPGETERTHVDVWLARLLAFLAQLAAPLADPSGVLLKFLAR